MKLYHGSWNKEKVLRDGFDLTCNSEMQALGCGIYFTSIEDYAHSYGEPIAIDFPELDNWDGISFNNPKVEKIDFSIGIIADHTPDGLRALRELEEDIYRKDPTLRMKRWDEIKQEYYHKAEKIKDNMLDKGVQMGWRFDRNLATNEKFFEFVVYDVDLVNQRLKKSVN